MSNTMKKQWLRNVSLLVLALALGLGLQQLVMGQACGKCCGNSLSNEGTRSSPDCPFQTCYWFDCKNTCVCSGNSINCGGDYPLNTDSCFSSSAKCPCDLDIFNSYTYGCSSGF